MVFEIDPDKPDVPALARILNGMGMLCLIGSIVALLLAFSRYTWVNEMAAMGAAGGAFLLALVFIGQGKTMEMLAVVSARLKSRFALENLGKIHPGAVTPEKKPLPAPTMPKERIIHVPDDQAREQGFKVR